MSLVSKFVTIILFAIIRIYQLVISPLSPPSCRFLPSCSGYMIEAIRTHGPYKGVVLGCKRLVKCHPFGACGFDPVPKK
jgi:putative membrane protein insertion efficiency factor